MEEYFTDEELACPCCKKININADFRNRLNLAREYAGVPFIVNSCCRCVEHNKDVGGKPWSSHLIKDHPEDRKCNAIDLHVKDKYARYKIMESLMKVGFTRFGDYPTFIHADLDETKPQECIW